MTPRSATTIVVIDDDPDVLRATARVLMQAGYNVISGVNAMEAMELTRRHLPAILLLDVMLPDGNGVDIAKKLKSEAELAGVCIILLSGLKTTGEDQAKGLDTGLADGYITRPFSKPEFLARIEAMLRLRSAQEELREALARLEKIASQVPGLVYQYRLRPDGSSCLPYASDAIRQIYRVSPEEVREDASKIFDAIHPDDRDGTLASIRASAQTMTPWVHEYRVKFGDGTERWLLGNAIPQAEAEGAMLWHGFTTDITERRRIQAELEAHRQQLEELVTVRTAQMQELSRQSVQLEEARREAVAGSQAKSAFLSVMSHEIRTPLNGVIGMTSLLSDTEMNEEQTEYTSVIRSSGEALLSVINDVLDFSKIEAGHLDIEHVDFDLRASLEDVVELLALKAQEKGLEFALLIRQELPERVKGDPSRFRQILLNLLSNAIKFTDQGEVSVIACLQANEPDGTTVVRVDVADTGLGIPPDRQAALFQPFVQADASTSRRFGGTGLGLAICRRLVEAQGGTIWLESKPGQGTTFSFTIPFGPAETTVAPELPMMDIQGLKILVVDDNATNRLVFREQLRAWSCQVEEAADPATVVATLLQAAVPFELVLLDFQMPGMDGLELAAQIRAQPGVSETPLVLMTSAPQRGDAKKSALCRLDGYLTKPVRRKALLGLLGAIRGSKTKGTGPLPLITSHTLRENPPARKIRVLVAEDNLVNQKLLSRMLEKEGYACDIAANGLEVLVAMQRIGYDIILMDRQMPELDGVEATQRIRASQERWSKVPIVAVSAGVTQEERQECLAAGMDGFLGKPVDRVELVKMLKKLAPERPWGIQPQLPDLDADQLPKVCAGDLEFQQELVTTFVKELDQTLRELEGACAAQDAPRLRRAAHSLKGASRYIGALRLAKVSEQMEKAAADGDLEGVAALTVTMVETARTLRSLLDPQISGQVALSAT